MIRVTRVSTALYHLPRELWWPVDLVDRTLAIDAIDLVTCEVETEDGVTGCGYTYTLQRGGKAVHAMLAEEIAPMLVGVELARPDAAWQAAWQALYRFGRGGVVSVALAAADVALWDALAKADGLPLHRYLGSQRESVPVYGSSIDLGYTHDALLATVRDWRSRGFSGVKVKVGRTVREDIERLAAVRDLIGPEVALMVDANNGWDVAEAARRIKLMERFDLSWVEEPLAADDIEGHSRLQAQTPTPIAAGETLFSVHEFARYMRGDALRYVQADVCRVGGITPWLQVAQLAAAHHLPLAPHFVQDLHVHLLCSLPNEGVLEYLPLFDSLIEQPLTVADGRATAPDTPGIGVAFRKEIIDRHLLEESHGYKRS